MKDTRQLNLQSSADEVYRIESFVDDLKQWLGFDDETYNKIMLALSEAVNNAIVHGNREDSDKEVLINAWCSSHNLNISVKDEGKGFDPDELPDPLKEENLLKQGGRGVFLIEQYCDEVVYKDGGSRIVMSFNLNSN